MNIDNQLIHNELKDYLFITYGLIQYAFGFTFFLLPYEIVTGGVTGFSAILFYAMKIPVENTYLIVNIALLVVGLKVLGWRFLMKTIYAIFMLYFLLHVGSWLMPVNPDGSYVRFLGEGQEFMALIVGCCITGSSLAIVFFNNGSTGGTDIIAASVNKYYTISLGQVLSLIDVFIIGSCLLFPQFGGMTERIHKVVFGLCAMGIECLSLDFFMNASRQSVQFLIFSKKYKEIAYAIGTQMDHGVTILDGHGWYTGQDMKVLCILAKKRESVNIFRLIKIIDPNAFVSQSSVVGVYGEGFDEMKVKVNDKHLKESEDLTRKAEEFYEMTQRRNQELQENNKK
ncbi:MAG: YitT family protein [Prevotella sp.]|jgi:uncharacterized membrane-anchored protein YitT (DUF2179 family)